MEAFANRFPDDFVGRNDFIAFLFVSLPSPELKSWCHVDLGKIGRRWPEVPCFQVACLTDALKGSGLDAHSLIDEWG